MILERELEPWFLVGLVTMIGEDNGSERKKARERKTVTGRNTSSGVEENWRSRGQQKIGRIGQDCGVGRAFAKRPMVEEGW